MQLTHALGKAKEATASVGKFTKALVSQQWLSFMFVVVDGSVILVNCQWFAFSSFIFYLQPSEPVPKGVKRVKVGPCALFLSLFLYTSVYSI